MLISEWGGKLLTEDQKDIHKIHQLLKSGSAQNIELAFHLADASDVDLSAFISDVN